MTEFLLKKRKKINNSNKKRTLFLKIDKEIDTEDKSLISETKNTLELLKEIKEDQLYRQKELNEKAKKKLKTILIKDKNVENNDKKDKIINNVPTSTDTTKNEGKIVQLLNSQFTGQTNHKLNNSHEKLMNEYIDNKLAEKKKNKNDNIIIKNQLNDEITDALEKIRKDEMDLYKLPEMTQETNTKIKNKKTITINKEENEGTISWNTGIAEIELPDTFIKKNIIETEKALEKRKINSFSENKLIIQSSALPKENNLIFENNIKLNTKPVATNYSVNFKSRN